MSRYERFYIWGTSDHPSPLPPQFVFIDGADIPVGPRPYKLKNALKIDSNAPHGKYIAQR